MIKYQDPSSVPVIRRYKGQVTLSYLLCCQEPPPLKRTQLLTVFRKQKGEGDRAQGEELYGSLKCDGEEGLLFLKQPENLSDSIVTLYLEH